MIQPLFLAAYLRTKMYKSQAYVSSLCGVLCLLARKRVTSPSGFGNM